MSDPKKEEAENQSEALHLGMAAFVNGKSFFLNPYPTGTETREFWECGWLETKSASTKPNTQRKLGVDIDSGSYLDRRHRWQPSVGPKFRSEIMSGPRMRSNIGAMGRIKIQKSPTITFTIDYPLTKPKRVTITHEDGSGWTTGELVDAIRVEYKKIYEEELGVIGKHPGYIGHSMNRKRSNGPYGIWGHDMTDLQLEGITQIGPGVWQLNMAS